MRVSAGIFGQELGTGRRRTGRTTGECVLESMSQLVLDPKWL